MAVEDLFRGFLAIELSEDVRNALRKLIGRFKSENFEASWIKPENLHMTLRFLGDITKPQSEQVCRSLRSRLKDIDPFGVRIGGVGVFPSRRKLRTLWAGAKAEEGVFDGLKARVEESVTSVGLCPDENAFVPHVTLARIRNQLGKEKLLRCLDRESSFEGGEFVVGSVSLFESTLTPRGSVYRKLETISF